MVNASLASGNHGRYFPIMVHHSVTLVILGGQTAPAESPMKILAILLLAASTLAAAVPEMKWETSLPAAQELAKSENKLIFLDVHTGWCYWCKKLQKDTFPSPEARSALARVVPLSIETQDESYKPTKDNFIEQQYKVDGYPTLLILNASGKEVARQPGYLPPREFAAWVTSVVKKK